MLRNKRYDLFFKMMGGQNGPNYRHMRDVKNHYINIVNNNAFGGMQAVTNPDGQLCKNHFLVAIQLLTQLPLEIIQKKITSATLWDTGEEWLNNTFSQEDINTIKQEYELWTQTKK